MWSQKPQGCKAQEGGQAEGAHQMEVGQKTTFRISSIPSSNAQDCMSVGSLRVFGG